ncbi:9613_t:CDS:2 [Paraglomus brasilianum]|uniref:9613_t:CDS:1 n=1 Tax=Paraglomus brasilianum TaxID=144538 RepID=A0A9N8YXL7_9GLOM|nr:9613_t:CDS:2 [Paraglomus brasilianum]
MAYERIFPKVNKPSGRKYAHTKCDGNNARRGYEIVCLLEPVYMLCIGNII